MTNPRFVYRLSVAGFMLVTLGIAIAWLAVPSFWTSNLFTRSMMVAFLVGLPWLGMQWMRILTLGSQKSVQEQVTRLCQTNLLSLSQPETSGCTGSLETEDSWTTSIREALLQHAQQFDEQEQAKQSADIRARRVSTERDQLMQVLRGLADPLVAVDSYGQILLTNDAFLELFAREREATDQQPIEKVITCDPLVETLETTRRRRSTAIRTTEACIPDSNGKSRWYRATCRPIATLTSNADGSQTGAVAVLSDITPQKLIQQRNAEFVAAVSHEMKTPLSSIKAYVELLADGEAEDDATREEFLEVINGQADRLKRLIDNLLNLARIEAGVVSVNKEQQPLNQILQEAVDVLRPAAELKKITLIADLSPLYLGVHADRDTLLQAAINLLSNAVKYTRDGGTVTVRSKSQEDAVLFEVQDTGVGLSAEDAHQVFEKFYRVKKDKDMAAGTGLGLPLVKHIVEDIHSGKIEVHSVLGTGSTFSVQLPQIRQLPA